MSFERFIVLKNLKLELASFDADLIFTKRWSTGIRTFFSDKNALQKL